MIYFHLFFIVILVRLVRYFWKHEWLLKIALLIVKCRLWKFFLQIFIHVFGSVYGIYYMHMVYTFQSSATIKGIGKYIFMILNDSFSVVGKFFTAFSTFTRVLILWCLRILWCDTFSCFFMLFYCWRTFFLYNWWRLIPKTAFTLCHWDWRCLMIFTPWLL